MTEAPNESIKLSDAVDVAALQLWRSIRAAPLHFQGAAYLTFATAIFLFAACGVASWGLISVELVIGVAFALVGVIFFCFVALVSDQRRWNQLVCSLAELRRSVGAAFSESWFRIPVLRRVRPFAAAMGALAANVFAECRWPSPFFADLIGETSPSGFLSSTVILVAFYVMMLWLALVLTLGLLDVSRWMWRDFVLQAFWVFAPNDRPLNTEVKQVPFWPYSRKFFVVTVGTGISLWFLIWLTRWPSIAWLVGIAMFAIAVAAIVTSLKMDQSHGPLALVAISVGAWLVEFLILGDGLPADLLSWAILMLNIVLAVFFVLHSIAHSHRSPACAN